MHDPASGLPGPISTALVDQVGEGLRVSSQDAPGLALGGAPARDGPGELRRARLRQQELLAAVLLGSPPADPAAPLHQGGVAAEAGLLELEPSVELGGPGARAGCDRAGSAELARGEPQGAQGVVVDPRELATQDPRPARQTLASHVARDAVQLVGPHDPECIYMEPSNASSPGSGAARRALPPGDLPWGETHAGGQPRARSLSG